MRLLWLSAVAAITMQPTAHAQSSKTGQSEVTKISEEDGWILFLDHTADDGCYIAKALPSMTLRMQHDPASAKIFVMIFNYRWKSLEAQKNYPITFTFDKNAPWDADATALEIGNAPGLAFTVGDKEFINEMSSSHFVTFLTGERLIGSFDLRGSAKALTRLGSCMTEMDKLKDPFANGPTRVPPPVFIPAKPKPTDDPFST
jgi:hypothetical protein